MRQEGTKGTANNNNEAGGFQPLVQSQVKSLADLTVVFIYSFIDKH
jgi:hypothetical protein